MVRTARIVALIMAALSLAPSFAHVLEAWPRLTIWPPELWREATVFNAQFAVLGVLGAPLEGGVILATAWLSYVSRHDGSFRLALYAMLLFVLGLALWFAWVAPANAELATWTPGPVPADFDRVRLRWETGHMVIAAVKLVAFFLLAKAVIVPAQR
jgi:hypothetical protein